MHALALAHDRSHVPGSAGRDAESRSRAMEHFYASALVEVLPCGTCRDRYRELMAPGGPLLEKLRTSLASDPPTLFEWTVELHNEVSKHVARDRDPAAPEPERWTVHGARTALILDGPAVAKLIGVAVASSALLALLSVQGIRTMRRIWRTAVR